MERKAEDILNGENVENCKDDDRQLKFAGYIVKAIKGYNENTLPEIDKETLWARISQKLQHNTIQKPKNIIFIWLKSACAIACVSIFAWLVVHSKNESLLTNVAQKNSFLLNEVRTVTLSSSNKTISYASDRKESPIDLKNYKQGSLPNNSGNFSTLTVPYGKKSNIILPDGSNVWLNAGSQLTFSDQFKGEKREVYLEGEAYFDISPDEKSPFYVHSSHFEICVLGTAFNVTCYNEDDCATAVVVNGKIAIKRTGEQKFPMQTLLPGKMAVLKRGDDMLLIHEDNPENFISWTKKQLNLNNSAVKDILVKLERIYNAEIFCEDGIQIHDSFSGTLDLSQPLSGILSTIFDPKIYEINNNGRRFVVKKNSD